MEINRREFFRASSRAALGSAGLFAGAGVGTAGAAGARRKFAMTLAGGPIGVKADIAQLIDFATRYGFEAIEPRHAELSKMGEGQIGELKAELDDKGIAWGVSGAPVNIRAETEDEFAAQLKRLPQAAKALRSAGAGRIKTYVTPHHPSLTYRANFELHTDRVRRIAEVAGDHGLRFGLEYVGPRTSMNKSKFPFIHTMAEMRELIGATGRDNVGLVLDAWHWYTAEESEAELLALSNDDIVSCDLNDAPAGIAVRDQDDHVRALPAATGVIDLKTFLGALVHAGYDGPVQAEPFDSDLRAMDDEAAVAKTAEAMKKAFALVE